MFEEINANSTGGYNRPVDINHVAISLKNSHTNSSGDSEESTSSSTSDKIYEQVNAYIFFLNPKNRNL